MHSSNGEGPSTGTRTSPRTAGSAWRTQEAGDAAGAERAAIRLAVEQGSTTCGSRRSPRPPGLPAYLQQLLLQQGRGDLRARITQSGAARRRPARPTVRTKPLIDALIESSGGTHPRAEPRGFPPHALHPGRCPGIPTLRHGRRAPLIEAIAHRTGTDPAKDYCPGWLRRRSSAPCASPSSNGCAVADSPPYVTVLGDALNQLRAPDATTHYPVQTRSAPRQPRPDTMNDRAA